MKQALVLVSTVLLSVACAAMPIAEPFDRPGSPESVDPAASAPPVTDALARLPSPLPVETAVPEAPWPTGAWPTSAPEEQGVDSQLLAEMFEIIKERDHSIDSVTVVRNGTIVADATVYPFRPDSQHIIHSCTKSIVSALIGIAIDQQHLEGLEQPVLDIFPERTVAHLDAHKEAMTLEHLLMMASGLECRDSYLYRWRGLQQMRQSGDWVQFVLDLPVAEPPGTRFEYCNGGSFLLSAIIQETTGVSAAQFAQHHLFAPLGIEDLKWPANPQGISIGWGELQMKPHDMAKIGYLYLNEGRWDGEQIVPVDWVRASTRKHISATLQDGYGYQWWVAGDGIFMALGYAGQYIVVVPALELVVVFTSDLAEEDFYVPQDLLNAFIIPAIRSSGQLPANPGGVARLEAAIEALTNPLPLRGPTTSANMVQPTGAPILPTDPPTATAAPALAATVSPNTGRLVIDFPSETADLKGGQGLRVGVSLVGPDGEPIEGATVQAELWNPDGELFGSLICADRGGGRYLADHVPLPLRDAGGAWRVVARAAWDQGERAELERTIPVLPSLSERYHDLCGFSGNTASPRSDNAVSRNQQGHGGGINLHGTLRLVNCTISDNRAIGPGGGVYVRGHLDFVNTIVANNAGKGGNCVVSGPDAYGVSGSLGTNSHNLVADGSCDPAYAADHLLGPLGDNGGDTLTHGLLPGSPAIDAVPVISCTVPTDQRGALRPAVQTSPETPCDIGAFEVQAE